MYSKGIYRINCWVLIKYIQSIFGLLVYVFQDLRLAQVEHLKTKELSVKYLEGY